jgi:hypothetical protein
MDEMNFLSLIRPWLHTNYQITTKFTTVSFYKKKLQLNGPLLHHVNGNKMSQETEAVFISKFWSAKIHCSISFVFDNNCPIID